MALALLLSSTGGLSWEEVKRGSDLCEDIIASIAKTDEPSENTKCGRVASNTEDRTSKLTEACQAMINREPCNEKSAEYVAIWKGCGLYDLKQPSTLNVILSEYSARCLELSSVDKSLSRRKRGITNPLKSFKAIKGVKKTLTSRGLSAEIDNDIEMAMNYSLIEWSLNDDFLASYRQAAPDEKPILSLIEGTECCTPKKCLNILLKPVVLLVGRKDAEVNQFPKDSGLRALRMVLFERCQSYVDAVAELMKLIIDYSALNKNQPDIYNFSQTTKNAVFRYKYCLHFLGMSNLEKAQLLGFKLEGNRLRLPRDESNEYCKEL